jgi:uncharacterized protein (DUF488 family)
MPSAVFTIGHSNHALETLLRLLQQHDVGTLVDVRTAPYSRYAPHFNEARLKSALLAAGVAYVFLGDRLGGRPSAPELYDQHGRVDYEKLAATPTFRAGIEAVLARAAAARLALLCGEEDPVGCHRRLLIGRALAAHGVTVVHIRGDGRLQREADLATLGNAGHVGQLFDAEEVAGPWKSIRSVSQKSRRPPSSRRSGEPG